MGGRSLPLIGGPSNRPTASRPLYCATFLGTFAHLCSRTARVLGMITLILLGCAAWAAALAASIATTLDATSPDTTAETSAGTAAGEQPVTANGVTGVEPTHDLASKREKNIRSLSKSRGSLHERAERLQGKHREARIILFSSTGQRRDYDNLSLTGHHFEGLQNRHPHLYAGLFGLLHLLTAPDGESQNVAALVIHEAYLKACSLRLLKPQLTIQTVVTGSTAARDLKKPFQPSFAPSACNKHPPSISPTPSILIASPPACSTAALTDPGASPPPPSFLPSSLDERFDGEESGTEHAGSPPGTVQQVQRPTPPAQPVGSPLGMVQQVQRPTPPAQPVSSPLGMVQQVQRPTPPSQPAGVSLIAGRGLSTLCNLAPYPSCDPAIVMLTLVCTGEDQATGTNGVALLQSRARVAPTTACIASFTMLDLCSPDPTPHQPTRQPPTANSLLQRLSGVNKPTHSQHQQTPPDEATMQLGYNQPGSTLLSRGDVNALAPGLHGTGLLGRPRLSPSPQQQRPAKRRPAQGAQPVPIPQVPVASRAWCWLAPTFLGCQPGCSPCPPCPAPCPAAQPGCSPGPPCPAPCPAGQPGCSPGPPCPATGPAKLADCSPGPTYINAQ
ncbi:hypothetical protein HaLaN_02461 [Haematococcus lacustris]|uniref:Uncharacterized protein n=1 Tax=Haematococcus lacustris TaxID=44745 RepID=A0A699YE02_HAELA|nr:hypothetical protein HaLaN_02461 [Haematococcus lacustris]